MRKLWFVAEKYRIHPAGYESEPYAHYGVFKFPFNGQILLIIATDGQQLGTLSKDYAWEHVSVSLETRTPTWEEMCRVKQLFWEDEETVIQFHVPKSQHKNYHNFCLHLWRPHNYQIPLPPSNTVAL